jgi:hypothetical protein
MNLYSFLSDTSPSFTPIQNKNWDYSSAYFNFYVFTQKTEGTDFTLNHNKHSPTDLLQFFMTVILNCYCRSQILKLRHILVAVLKDRQHTAGITQRQSLLRRCPFPFITQITPTLFPSIHPSIDKVRFLFSVDTKRRPTTYKHHELKYTQTLGTSLIFYGPKSNNISRH